MAKLTKEEMAVLNSLIYLETNVWDGFRGAGGEQPQTLGDIAGRLESNPDLWKCGGGMSEETFKKLFEVVKSNPSLRMLELVRVKESDYTKHHAQKSDAPILAFKNDDNYVVAFRGTEPGTDEADDNLRGLNETDTEAQKRALDYITILHDEYGFDNISVTGHSKGGNKAMYVTVLSDYVADCTAFDAQGFSLAFHGKYRDRIAGKKDKITLITSDQSLVGSLLSSVAGETIYTSTEGLVKENHSLEPFPYHTMDTYYTINNGKAQLREETTGSTLLWMIGGMTGFASAVASGYSMDPAFFPKMAAAVMDSFIGNTGEILKNWRRGVNADGSPAFSTQIMRCLERMIPGMQEIMGEGLPSMIDGEGNVSDIFSALQFLGEYIWMYAGCMAKGVVAIGGIDLTVGSGAAAAAVMAITVTWAFVKVLELVIPMLLHAGVALTEIVGAAIGMAASWIVENVTRIGKAVIDGFGAAVNEVGRFVSRIADFFDSMAKGTAAWIQGIFGSANAAIAYAQDLDVTMSRIEEMRQYLGKLSSCYHNAGNAADGAGQVAGRIYSYYPESYVRSCCHDIQYHLKCAKSSIVSAERALERKRRALSEAAEAYRRTEWETAGVIRGYAHG